MRNFEKGRGGGGGVNLGYLKKRGCSGKQRQGEHWKAMFKINLVILRGGEID